MAKLTFKVGETDTEFELSNEQIAEIKQQNNFFNKEEILSNSSFFEEHKNKHKKEVLDGVDSILRKYESDLTTEELESYKKGDTTFKKADALINTLKSRLGNTADKGELEVWKAEVEKERKLRSENYIDKAEYEKIQRSQGRLEKQIVANFAVMESVRSGILSDDWSEKPIFKNIIKEAVSETLKGGLDGKPAKAIYDAETGEIRIVQANVEGNLPIVKDGTALWSFQDVVKKALIDNKLNKVAQTPNVTPATVTSQSSGNAVNTGVLDRIKQLQEKNKQT